MRFTCRSWRESGAEVDAILHTTGYGYFVVIVPAVVVAPRYFAGEIDFGAITQASFALAVARAEECPLAA